MLSFFKKILPTSWFESKPIIPTVRLTGVIAERSGFRQGLSYTSVVKKLEEAFSYKKAPAVAIIINSPGGSPVQSNLIFKLIRDLSDKHETKVLVFVEDVAASGGYMIALAGDEIIVDPSSIIGSIGVIYSGFGFQKAIEKLGVDRRVYTAGENKMSLDAFQEEKPEEIEYLKALQSEIHHHFIEMVKGRRGDVLQEDDTMFTGRFWVGEQAVSLGLVDKIGDLRSEIKKRYGDKAESKLIEQPRGFLKKMIPGVMADGVLSKSLVDPEDILHTLENKALWSRFGF